MTLPNERSRAFRRAKQFLRDLLDPKKTPKIPRAIRQEAARVLRHYPSSFDIVMAKDRFSDIFCEDTLMEEYKDKL